MNSRVRNSVLVVIELEGLELRPVNKENLMNDYSDRFDDTQSSDHLLRPRTRLHSNSKSRVRSKKGLTSIFTLLVLAAVFFSLIVGRTFPYPLRASCLIKWEFAEPCNFVMQRLRSQIIKWSRLETCGTKCFYKLNVLHHENDTIQAVRVSPRLKITDDIDILFYNPTSKSCIALAESTSKFWYNIFDNGRNYCNLYHLIVGTGYDLYDKFVETTNNAICTQYDMVYCD